MFTVIPIASSIHDAASVERIVGAYRAALASVGGSLEPTDGPALPFVLTGGTEAQILEQWDDDEPLFLIAHPNQNSLPSSLEALARVGQLGGRGRILYVNGPDDVEGLEQLAEAVHDLDVFRRMRDKIIGVVGPPSDWLVASMPDPAVLQAAWGPTAIPIGLDRLYRVYTTDPEIEPLPAGETRVTIGEIDKAEGIYRGLQELIVGEHLDALSLRCFDVIGDIDTTGCLALARLNDEGTIAGCEGDLVSTVTMMWVRELLGEVAWMANPSRARPMEDTLWLAHCTVPPSLVSKLRLDTHFESNRGVGMHGDFALGPITVVRVGGNEMEQIWLAEGEILHPGDEPDLCRTQVEIRLQDGAVTELLNEPLGNHLVMIRGHHADRLRSWWTTMVAPRGGGGR
jgi:L-fucose isomerase-like protein